MKPEYAWKARVEISTDHPDLLPIVQAIDELDAGSTEHAHMVAHLFLTHAMVTAHDEGYRSGFCRGHDEGAAPFLDGPWWKRAWTAARS